MPLFSDIYKLFKNAFRPSPGEEAERMPETVGIVQPDVDIRGNNDGFWSGGRGVLRVSNDFVDLSSISNRTARYKEYERLRSVAEIETALTIFADEMCVAGHTKVATPFGFTPIAELAKNYKSGERFLVYAYDFSRKDYTLAWAYNPRLVKTAPTIRVAIDNGSSFDVTPDHRVLLRSGEWRMAGELRPGDELMPFHRVPANQKLTGLKHNQFARIFTFADGWKHERQFIDDWKNDKKNPKYEVVNQAARLIQQGLNANQITRIMEMSWVSVRNHLNKHGFTYDELKSYSKKPDRRRVIGLFPNDTIDVYDLSVEIHENFCGEEVVFHNCQTGENDNYFDVKCRDDEVKEEAEFLLNEILEVDEWIWNEAKNLCLYGDRFWEVVISQDNPKKGIVKVASLPPDSMYRIETTKGKLLEFQQSKEGPDYQSLARVDITQATEADLAQATALRFAPEQIVHLRIGDDRKTFYPYGISLVEAARGPAHQLRLMEDAMVVYRLCLVGDTRIRTNHGWKYIKDIKPGDSVWCHPLDSSVLTLTGVKWAASNGIKETYRVRSRHNELVGTATHPVLVRDGSTIGYVELAKLVPGRHELINSKRARIETQKELSAMRFEDGQMVAKLSVEQRSEFRNRKYENITELMRQCSGNVSRIKQFLYRSGKCLPYELACRVARIFGLDCNSLIVCNKGEVNPERIKLPKYVNSDFARLFGFMLGDGFVSKHNIGFAAGVDSEVNSRYRDLLARFFTEVKWNADKRSSRGLGNYIVSSKTASRLFEKMGYIRGSKNKRIPSWVFTAPAEIQKAVILGLSDADGCERHTPRGSWYSTIELCNKQLVEDVKDLWHGLGLASGHIKYRYRNGGHKITSDRIMKPSESWSVTISDMVVPEYEVVQTVVKEDQQEVFDIEVNHECHNFIANGMPVHNSRAPERRVFYIDVGQLPPFKAEAFIERMKDQFRKKKVHTNRGGGQGASGVEERWHAPSADEDYWLPIRPNSMTKIETLPGAQNLGEIDDALYFRNKLYVALNFPKNYAAQEADSQQTRITLSSQDVKFARLIERLQKSIAKGLRELVVRHLRLLGYPEEKWSDLRIKMTPPSDWREISRNEVVEARYNRAAAMKGSQLFSDYDILVDILHVNSDKAKECVARMKQQKLEDLKLQVAGSNPDLLGLGQPPSEEKEIGADASGPSPNPTPQDAGSGSPPPPDGGNVASPGAEPTPEGNDASGAAGKPPGGTEGSPLPEPSEDEIRKYNLGIRNQNAGIDEEEVDDSELGEG